MGQSFHKFKAETFDEAYQQMVRKLGRDAIVLHTAEVKEGGVLGVLGKKMVEVTASTPPEPKDPATRRRSLPEKRYQAHSGAIGSDENVTETVAYFRQLVQDAQARMAQRASVEPAVLPNAPLQPVSTPVPAETPYPAEARAPQPHPAPIIPFPTRQEGQSIEDLQREIRQMRELLEVAVAEGAPAGIPPEFAPQYRMLIERGVCRKTAAALLAGVLQGSDLNIMRNPLVLEARLKMEIQKRLVVTNGLRITKGKRHTVVLVGATGVGKTTNLAKLAALFAVNARAHVAMLTMDTYRVAAPEQLRVYASIIGLPMQIVNDARETERAMQAYSNCDLLLIDTAGGSQFNVAQIDELSTMLDVAKPDEVMLVLSANTQLEDLRSAVANFRKLRPTSLLFSKLDETRRYGALFSVAAEAGLPLSYFSIGQNVPDDIEVATTGRVAKLIIENGGT